MDLNLSAQCERSVESEASLNFSSTSRFLPASHLEVERAVIRPNSESAEHNPLRSRASRRSSSDLPLTTSKEESLDNLDSPITHHRHRRRRIDQSSSANRSDTLSHATPAKPKKSTTSSASSEYPIAGFFPRLSRILEHKDEETTKRHSRSPASNIKEQDIPPRRSDATNVDRRRTAKYRTYYLQQELSSLSNPSLASLFSSLTNSSGSSGSSTVTQRSYDRSVGVRRRRRVKHRSNSREELPSEDRGPLKLSRGRRSDSMDPLDSHIATIEEEAMPKRSSKPPSRTSIRSSQIVSDGHGDESANKGTAKPPSRASSRASSSKSESHDEDIKTGESSKPPSRASSRASSFASDSHDEQITIRVKSKPPSRARSKASSSTSIGDTDEPPSKVAPIGVKRKSFPSSPNSGSFTSKNVWKRQDTFNSDSGISVSSSPEVNTRPEQISSAQHSEAEEADSDDETSSSSSDDDEEETSTRPCATARSSSTTITSANTQPRALMDNDPLVQRLQEQEEEMKMHMDLHSPRPQRSFRPPVTSPCEPSPALPLFDHRATSAVPTHFAFPPHAPDLPHRNGGFLHPHYQHAMPPPPPFHPDPKKKTVAGYELLAEKLAEQSQEGMLGDQAWQPAYRKFAQLNHRILLHLQDEISELEGELRIIDESIAQMAEMMEGEVPPASRRMETRFGSEMHHRRTELLGRVFQKLGQYNQALASYASACKNYSPAHESEISAYRAWMTEHEAVDEAESHFLEHKQDLMTLKRKQATPPNPAAPRHEKFILFLALLIPPIAISLVTGVLSKLVIMGILAFTGYVVLESKPTGAVTPVGKKSKKSATTSEKETHVEKSIIRSRPNKRSENV